MEAGLYRTPTARDNPRPWCVTKRRLDRTLKGEEELLHAAPVQRVRVPSR